MSKPLTDDQLANVRQCTIYLAYEEYDERERADLDAALARLDFLERKLKADSRTRSDGSIQAIADSALQAYNDITE
jgi:hypothetical protein